MEFREILMVAVIEWASPQEAEGGTRPPVQNSGGTSPRNRDFVEKILSTDQSSWIFQYFQSEVTDIREKSEFAGRWLWRT